MNGQHSKQAIRLFLSYGRRDAARLANRLLPGWRFAPEGQTKPETDGNKKRKLNHNLIAWEHLGKVRKKDFDQAKTVLRVFREFHKDRICIETLPGEHA